MIAIRFPTTATATTSHLSSAWRRECPGVGAWRVPLMVSTTVRSSRHLPAGALQSTGKREIRRPDSQSVGSIERPHTGGRYPGATGQSLPALSGSRGPYSHQYNLSWEPDWFRSWKLQLGYVGSRSHKLLVMWYLNRAQPVPGIPQTTATINERRPDPTHAEKRTVVNGSRGYYDAARVSIIVPDKRGLSLNASYWFSKAMDLGSSYTNTAYAQDSRISRSQSEFENQHDMRGLSLFDQPHALLATFSYRMPVPSGWNLAKHLAGGWTLSAVVLVKSGTPFTVYSGSDGPGYGNVDGNGQDGQTSWIPRYWDAR